MGAERKLVPTRTLAGHARYAGCAGCAGYAGCGGHPGGRLPTYAPRGCNLAFGRRCPRRRLWVGQCSGGRAGREIVGDWYRTVPPVESAITEPKTTSNPLSQRGPVPGRWASATAGRAREIAGDLRGKMGPGTGGCGQKFGCTIATTENSPNQRRPVPGRRASATAGRARDCKSTLTFTSLK